MGAFEDRLEAITAMRTKIVAPATGESRAYSVLCSGHDRRSGKRSQESDVYTSRAMKSAPGRSELYRDGRGYAAPTLPTRRTAGAGLSEGHYCSVSDSYRES